MSEEQDKNQLSPEETEEIYKRQRPIALSIAREAVKSAKIPLYTNDEFTNQRWRISYGEVNNDIALTIELNPIFTRAIIHSSLGLVAWEILRELELLFSNPKAMEYFFVEESEREKEIYDIALKITSEYVQYLPLVIFHSFHQTLNETMISHIKKFVDYNMREYLDKIGKPQKKFTLLPNNDLKDITKLFPDTEFQLITRLGITNEEFSAYRKAPYGDRQVWLTPEAFGKLPSLYEQLKLEYKKAKTEYKLEYKAFHRVNRQTTPDDWEKHWEEFFDEKFLKLFLTTEIKSLSAAQLAYKQLADTYGFSADYMVKLVRNAKAQAKSEMRLNSKKMDNQTKNIH